MRGSTMSSALVLSPVCALVCVVRVMIRALAVAPVAVMDVGPRAIPKRVCDEE